MNKLFLLLTTLFFIASCATPSTNAEKTTILLVRHAEKGAGKNPGLTSKGKKRAQSLIQKLKPWNITGIYSTNYKRTLETAIPLSKALKIDINHSIPPMNYKALFEDIKAHHKGRAVLVVGHSNTTPEFVNHMDPKQDLPFINENDYSNLYVIEWTENNVQFQKMTY